MFVKGFSGRIIDFDGTRALIYTERERGDSLTIENTTSETLINVEILPNLTVESAGLTPTGVIYTTKQVGGNILTARLYDWNNTNLRDLGIQIRYRHSEYRGTMPFGVKVKTCGLGSFRQK